MDMMISCIKMKITCLVSLLTMTRIVLNPKNDGNFLMKFIKIEFDDYLGIGSYLRDLYGL